ncbi:MAG: YajD family HNH nuclease [Methylotenera sp.]|nr:YajD family HNH nuclease [Methylotenera sp.]
MADQATLNQLKLDNIVAEARLRSSERETSYRERALKLYPWICGRCAREFSGARLRELTVHHRDHNHDNNPLDGSNWELLCIYCHENEHARILDESLRGRAIGNQTPMATHHPFADLQTKLNQKK